MPNLDSLLNPKSIAVIGASRSRKKLGRLVLDNIIKGRFKGRIYPVNPKASQIAKLTCYSSVAEINDDVDLALIAIPVEFVYPVVKECCEKNVGSIVIISSGFSEVGQRGLEEELKIKRMVKEHGVNLLGPNCLGVISPFSQLNATFAKNKVIEGNVAFLSQSGALGTAALDWAEECGVGFSHFISLGNKAGLAENDFIEVFSKEDKVKAIALYLEDFADGRAFMEYASKAKKPIVVLKPGESEAAQVALGSHTGSLAQDEKIVSAALKQSGVVRVSAVEELFNFIQLLSWGDRLEGNQIAIITNAGGPGVITTDAIELNNLKLAKFSKKTEKRLASKLPTASNIKNPVDVLGDALADRYNFALETVAADKGVGGIIVLLTPQVMTEIKETAKAIINFSKKNKKLIIASFIGGEEVKKGRKILSASKVPCFRFPVDAIKALSYMFEYEKVKAHLPAEVLGTPACLPTEAKASALLAGIASIAGRHAGKSKRKTIELGGKMSKVKKLLYGKSGAVDAQAAEKVLRAYKIPLLSSYFPQDIADARRVAQRLKYPVVMKLIHPKLLHKTEVEAVKLNVKNQVELNKSYGELGTLAKRLKLADYKIEMQHFVRGALELIIGVKYDSDLYVEVGGEQVLRKRGFGHSMVFGMGGIYTEVFRDVSLRIVPLSTRDVEEMIEETKVSQILRGVRGVKYNLKKVKEIISKINQLVLDFPTIRELDINPLFAKGKDVWVVDVKMILEKNRYQ